MAFTIRPGYDFLPHEIPTRDTLLRQAKYLTLRGVGLGQVDAALIGIKSGTTSGTTSSSLPAPGWMWADPGGSLWVETGHGPVKLHRSGGGFESVRWAQTYAPEVSPVFPGSPFQASPVNDAAQQTEGLSPGAGASESVSMWDEAFVDSNAGALMNVLMMSAETMASSQTYPRLVGRGLTVFHLKGTVSPHDFCCRRPAGARVISTNNEWSGAFINTESNIVQGQSKEHFYGIFVAPHSGTSLVGSGARIDMEASAFGWKYDQSVWGPGATI